ncbi:hypothetical protein ACS5PU_02195 [Pedobacter sp. GSP4]|uniref:hypothetical protein n=1 Tax=Pedobacter sp. GSP4 TaxID=3453716 RepID=UPI003EECF2F9
MLRAGALYFAVISAFLIAVICASLIMVAAYYREGNLKERRRVRLERNMSSAIGYVLKSKEKITAGKQSIDLLGEGKDSVEIDCSYWGVFPLSVIRAFTSSDTLSRVFLMGMDPGKDQVALYLSDEDRPLSVSGDTRIFGDAVVPRSGMRRSYVENRSYSGTQLVYGKVMESGKTLTPLDKDLIAAINRELDKSVSGMVTLPYGNLDIPFLKATKIFAVPGGAKLSGMLSGKLVLYSDTTIIITGQARLENTVVYARSIRVEEGFRGSCQLFARDSITLGDRTILDYPSVLGLVAKEKMVDQSKITIGKDVIVSGSVFSYEPKRTPLQTMVSLSDRAKIKGELYSTGIIKLAKGAEVEGKTSCNRFVMQTPTTLYENFLVDVLLNRKGRDRHYLSPQVFKASGNEKKILLWLN